MTTKTQTSSSPDKLLDTATQWVARMLSDQITESDLQDFALWLAQDDTHKVAYDEIADLWLDLAAVKHLPMEKLFDSQLKVDSQLNADNKEEKELAAADVVVSPTFGNTSKSTSTNISSNVINLFNWRNSVALAASITLAVALLPGLFSKPEPQLYVTAVGETNSVLLDDGSTITLNTNTRLEVVLTDKQRLIQLDHGEAFFSVAKDPSRPFIVQSCASQAQALGTAFNVRCHQGTGAVAVTQGVVKVTNTEINRSPTQSHTLKVGQFVTVVDQAGISSTKTIEPGLIATWRQGELVFDNTPLSEVLEEVNRYSQTPLRLGSESLLHVKVTGRFGLEDPMILLKALEQSLSLRSKTMDDGTIELIPAS